VPEHVDFVVISLTDSASVIFPVHHLLHNSFVLGTHNLRPDPENSLMLTDDHLKAIIFFGLGF